MRDKFRRISFLYHYSDKETFEELKAHLHFPQKNGKIQIIEGFKWTGNMITRKFPELRHVEVFGILVSDNLLKSLALREILSEIKNMTLIPILVDSEWKFKAIYQKPSLPLNKKPISEWKLRDEALLTVANELISLIEGNGQNSNQSSSTTSNLSDLERKGLEDAKKMLIEKISYLRVSMASMSEGSNKFSIIQDIKTQEKQIKEIDQKLGK